MNFLHPANHLFRAAFVVICIVLGIVLARSFYEKPWLGGIAGASFGFLIIGIDLLLRNFTIRGFSNATFGLMIGLFCGWLINQVKLFDGNWWSPVFEDAHSVQSIYELIVYLAFGFLGTSFAMRSPREEFSLLIPYVRFRQDSAQDSPLLVDTNIIIDGRIPKICDTGFLSGSLVVPRFVLDELQTLADSRDSIKRERGKRGLACLNTMRNTKNLDVSIHEDYLDKEETVDAKLIQLARLIGARLLTNDANLGKVARLRGVTVLNFNDLSRSMRPMVMPGDPLELKLVKEGKDPHQSVGYLPDGTMIVVNHSREWLGETVEVTVGGTTPTSAGRLIFAELREGNKKAKPQKNGNEPSSEVKLEGAAKE